MRFKPPFHHLNFVALILLLSFLQGLSLSHAQNNASIPLDETKSAPAIDLLKDGVQIDRDILIDLIRKENFDTSTLEPQTSNIYNGVAQTLVQPADIPFPIEKENLSHMGPLPQIAGLARARVKSSHTGLDYIFTVSLDTHAAMARSALLRRLGYTIGSPKHYKTLSLTFSDKAARESFVNSVVLQTGGNPNRWIPEWKDDLPATVLTLKFQDIVLESSYITDPQLHWGAVVVDPAHNINTINSRRAIRASLVPLTLLDIPQSVNMYSMEPAKIFDEAVVFSRPPYGKLYHYPAEFQNETSIGDVRWIAKRIAKLSRDDWTKIIAAGGYPADISALLVEKTLARVNQLMRLLSIKDFTPFLFSPYLTYGNVINGKATVENYDGYAQTFTFGDPQSPLRASELGRFFAIEAVSSGMRLLFDKANKYLQVLTPEKYIKKHQENFLQSILDHQKANPGQPYIQPVEAWGGPIAGGSLQASRSVMTGTYYGSDSPIQLVDQIAASVKVGGFFGISGVGKLGISISPQASYTRSYVHVRPVTSMKAALKENWGHIILPTFMHHLAKILDGPDEEKSEASIEAFLSKMETGEMLIVTDGINYGAGATVGIPLAAMLGAIPPFNQLVESLNLNDQNAILARTTIYKASDGIHVYLNRIRTGNFEVSLDTQFFLKIMSLGGAVGGGKAHTKAFILPSEFKEEAKQKSFQRAISLLLRRNNPSILEDSFYPYTLDHKSKGKVGRFKLGPWSWTKRETLHQVEVTPPYDPEGKYNQNEEKRTVVEGQLTKVKGTDLYGFFGGILNFFVPEIKLGGNAKGDDPASNFMGRSNTFSVSTEIEVTPSRPNHLFTRIQNSRNGWDLRRKRLLKIIDGISSQLHEFNPNGGLIDANYFSQTKRVQAFSVLYSLLVYEEGIEKLFEYLDLRRHTTEETAAFLIGLMGHREYRAFCEKNELPIEFTSGPFTIEYNDPRLIESTKGQTTVVGCATSWMKTVFSLRSKLQRHAEIFNTDIHDIPTAKEKVKWINRIILDLDRDMELAHLLRWLGKDQAFLQVRVSGFRTHDEIGDTEYFSNTSGTYDKEVRAGPLSDISANSHIISNELSARYLSNGY